MKKLVLALALIFFVFAISACVHIAYGPTDNITDAAYVQSVQAIIGNNEAIKFMDKAYMLADTKTPGPAQTWGVFGTIVVTDKTLYFLFWNRNANAFDVLRKLPITDMLNIDHISSIFGPGDYVRIEDGNNRFDLFCCWEMYNASSDPIKNNKKFMTYLEASGSAI